ncbi:CRISPR-associated helicase, Cas3 family [Rhizobium sp. RU20A]|uniref:CRISPR-associated helicase Cas3' n=1 Tax=Rhizobium sp. RU20A TaxID=1907412 RepID=UPI000955EF73|nr:CRISPR-associated helicase Cas3' [Rhizobium sp. RU20A]SIR18967.1 CRISPR-associated helicase, Cas3 family [Rhizobium sp. RU20A]
MSAVLTLPWGKLGENGSHHLAHHCADVAACFDTLSGLPVVRRRLETAAGRALTEQDVARLAMVVFLHDCGKLHPGFQVRALPPGAGWPGICPRGHVAEGAALFDGVADWAYAKALHVSALKAWGVAPGLRQAAFAHHGRPFTFTGRDREGWASVAAAGYDPLAAAQALGGLMRGWFDAAFAPGGDPLPSAPSFQHLFCGLVSLADWLGSTEAVFPYVAEADAAYMDHARHQAALAVADIGLDASRFRAAMAGKVCFETVSGGHPPRPAQTVTAAWPLDDPLLILEAETGSGKTEAALYRFAQLFEAGLVDSLYFALPTRAAARQIHQRVNDALVRLMGAGAPEAALAVPGYLKAGTVSGQRLPGFRVLWDDDPDEPLRLARWAAESGRRMLAATVAVGTVDQAMLAALQVKHAHLRAAALSRALLVIDEVHASDAYMTNIQSHLLNLHLSRGGHAMLMSATLAAEARALWLGTDRRTRRAPDFDTAVAAPYPAVWGHKGGVRSVGTADQRQKDVAMTLVAGWSGAEAAIPAVAAARAGAKVLVIRNTVRAALETFDAIETLGAGDRLLQVADGPALHHSRFAAEDRALLDAAVEAALSPKEMYRPVGGSIVVGTQTLEQSLDIDADLLITDLCPVDVLLQRIGRLHRHVLPRPAGFEVARCMVLTPEGGLDRLTAPSFDNGLGAFRDGGGVYRNLHAAELTRRLVLSHPAWAIPDMNRLLVESALHNDRLDALDAELGGRWPAYRSTEYGRDIADAQGARHVRLPVTDDFMELKPFADEEMTVRTRLGAEGALITFTLPVTGPFGAPVTGITLPAHWGGVFSKDPVPAESDGETVRFSVMEAGFVYGRRGLERAG